jgi:hypothetical protein
MAVLQGSYDENEITLGHPFGHMLRISFEEPGSSAVARTGYDNVFEAYVELSPSDVAALRKFLDKWEA